jgi:hypothetical protein
VGGPKKFQEDEVFFGKIIPHPKKISKSLEREIAADE